MRAGVSSPGYHLHLPCPRSSPALRNNIISVINSLTAGCTSAMLWAGSRPMGAPGSQILLLPSVVSFLWALVSQPPWLFPPLLESGVPGFSFPLFASPRSDNLTQVVWHRLPRTTEVLGFIPPVPLLLFILLLNDAELRRRKSLQLLKGCCSDLKQLYFNNGPKCGF